MVISADTTYENVKQLWIYLHCPDLFCSLNIHYNTEHKLNWRIFKYIFCGFKHCKMRLIYKVNKTLPVVDSLKDDGRPVQYRRFNLNYYYYYYYF